MMDSRKYRASLLTAGECCEGQQKFFDSEHAMDNESGNEPLAGGRVSIELDFL